MMLNLFWTGLCSIFGYSAFVAFLILKNYPSAVLGLLSGTTDAVTCFLILLRGKGTLPLWYDQNALKKFCRLGIAAATIGLLNLGYHVTIQIMLKTHMCNDPSLEGTTLQEVSKTKSGISPDSNGKPNYRPVSEFTYIISTVQVITVAYTRCPTLVLSNLAAMLPVAHSEVVCIVWSFILMRSGIVLMYHAIVYQNINDVRLLPEHNEESSEDEETKEEMNEALSSVLTSS